MTIPDYFCRAIEDNPADLATWGALADWLSESGDEVGHEMVSWMVRMKRHPKYEYTPRWLPVQMWKWTCLDYLDHHPEGWRSVVMPHAEDDEFFPNRLPKALFVRLLPERHYRLVNGRHRVVLARAYVPEIRYSSLPSMLHALRQAWVEHETETRCNRWNPKLKRQPRYIRRFETWVGQANLYNWAYMG